jgi:excisionase family DNA binding protein
VPPTPLLNYEEARAYLGGMSERKLRRLVADGAIPATRIGGRHVRFLRAALDAYIVGATRGLDDDLRQRLVADASRLLDGAPPVSDETAASVAKVLAGAEVQPEPARGRSARREAA